MNNNSWVPFFAMPDKSFPMPCLYNVTEVNKRTSFPVLSPRLSQGTWNLGSKYAYYVLSTIKDTIFVTRTTLRQVFVKYISNRSFFKNGRYHPGPWLLCAFGSQTCRNSRESCRPKSKAIVISDVQTDEALQIVKKQD